MSVEQNVAYAGRGRPGEVLDRFRIAHLARARPGELSGGSASESALPALSPVIRRPSSRRADVRSRHAHAAGVRAELRSILDRLDLPVLLVTHDFQDAAVLADRVGVLVDGHLLQVGSPAELIASPTTLSSRASRARTSSPACRTRPDGLTMVTLDDGVVLYSVDEATGPVDVAVYPWEIAIARAQADDSALNHVRAPITSLVQIGNRTRVQVGALVGEVTTASVERLELRNGEIVVASFKAAATRLVARS